MPRRRVNGIQIDFSETGSGFPLVWCHEFAGRKESWAPQVEFFARRYRLITYNARGYPPSDVPIDPAAYSQQTAVEDLCCLLDSLGVTEAYVGGLSMGGGTALHFAIRYPQLVRALILAGTGGGSTDLGRFREDCEAFATRLEVEGVEAIRKYADRPSRLYLKRKNHPRWAEFLESLDAHSSTGLALTLRGVQAQRPSILDLGEQLRRLDVPTLIVVGDGDISCLEPALFMKSTIPKSALAVLPGSGHAINLEEPGLFNQFVFNFLQKHADPDHVNANEPMAHTATADRPQATPRAK